jgi:hypothetical protein
MQSRQREVLGVQETPPPRSDCFEKTRFQAPSLLVFFIIARQDSDPNLDQFFCLFLALFHLLFPFSFSIDLDQLPRIVFPLVDVISPKSLAQWLFLFVCQCALQVIGWLCV